jgi:hypothetical protein
MTPARILALIEKTGVIALRWWQARQIPAGSKIGKDCDCVPEVGKPGAMGVVAGSPGRRVAEQIIGPVWEGLAGFVDDAIKHAGDADQGIWEIRGEPQHFTESAVMCWLATAPAGFST